MSNHENWYYSLDGKDKVGPISWTEVWEIHQAGMLPPDALIWAPHLPGWVPAKELIHKSMERVEDSTQVVNIQSISSELSNPNTKKFDKNSTIPEGIKGWSWGAFLLNWIWSIGNNTWIGLLSLIPYLGIIMVIILGIKGREWAWKNKQWDSVEHFQRVQRKWSKWGVIALLVPLVIGIISAIAIPALLGQRARARDKSSIANMNSILAELVGQYDKSRESNQSSQEIHSILGAYLQQSAGNMPNPWNPKLPGFAYTITISKGSSLNQVTEAARTRATEIGQCVYVIEFPEGQQPGCICGAVRVNGTVQGSNTFTSSVALE